LNEERKEEMQRLKKKEINIMASEAIIDMVEVKVKLSHYCHASNKGERSCSSYSFLTSALEDVSGRDRAPTVLYPQGKNPWYPLNKKPGGPQSWSGHRG
jgi:hypothetical protein